MDIVLKRYNSLIAITVPSVVFTPFIRDFIISSTGERDILLPTRPAITSVILKKFIVQYGQ